MSPTNAENMPTRAVVLTAGRGTRLRPLTETVPKCMVPLSGKPLLEHTVERLRGYGVTQLSVNLHYLPEIVPAYFGWGGRWGVQITYLREDELLGTAGSVKKMAADFDRPFFVWYGDNLSSCRLDLLWRQHFEKGADVTVALHEREDPTQSGIVGLDGEGRITRFLEKPRPEQVFSHLVSAGIFVLNPSVLDAIPAEGASDFGRDIFPRLLAEGARLYGYRMGEGEGLWWIDTPSDLQRVQATLERGSTGVVTQG
ncbi:MAG: mannose-phosphate guanylyltransferase [Acidobacteriota bacterium]|jgi:NDP-sugar pyrophosphorylase family protein|nr:mannose-phosphate guanylyltransferase [Acidobacteriota bacterium]